MGLQARGLRLLDVFDYGRTRHAGATVTTIRNGVPREASFSEVAARVGRLSAGLAAAGLRPGDVLATACRNHQEHLELFFAAEVLGACFVPLNYRVDDGALTSMLSAVRPRVLCAERDAAPRLAAAASALLDQDALKVVVGPDGARPEGWLAYDDVVAGEAYPRPSDAGWVDEDTTAAVLFTGGTTGEPKGAVYSARSLYLHTFALSSKLGFPLEPGDKALALVPIFHGLSWQLLHLCWLSGIDLVFIDGPLPGRDIVSAVEATGATFSAGVPTVWHEVVQFADGADIRSLRSLKKVVLGGSAVPVTLPLRLAQLGVTSYISWGMTETLPSTLSLVAGPDGVGGSEPDVRTSHPIPGVVVRAVDDEGVPAEETGQLEIRAPWITGNYLGQEAGGQGWFPTGDIGAVGPHGQFTILGRAKEMIKSGGEAIWPSAIESALVRHPAVLDAAVIGIPHERWGEQPLACVVSRDGIGPEELHAFLLERLPKWQVPRAWVMEQALPQTAAGKVDKRNLADLIAAGSIVAVHV